MREADRARPFSAAVPRLADLGAQRAEVAEFEAVHGARPVAWLLDHMPVDSRGCFVHATHLSPQETGRLARSGAAAGLCPITEANLGDGAFVGEPFFRAGGSSGIGSDSHVRISVAEELRTLEYSQRLRDEARAVLAARGGAQALGRGSGMKMKSNGTFDVRCRHSTRRREAGMRTGAHQRHYFFCQLAVRFISPHAPSLPRIHWTTPSIRQ